MLTPGARAKKFIRPRGSNAIFASKRGLLAPAPIKESQTTPDQKTPSRFGKAFSMDYTKFFGAKRTTKAMRGAVKAIKDILVETFAAAMSLGATIRNIVKQLSGLGAGRAGGGGLLGKLGMVGLIAAVVAGVAAIFGPKIKEVFDNFKAGANQVFENVKGFLDGIEQKIISIYNFVRDLYNNKFKGILKAYNDTVQSLAEATGISFYKIPLEQFKDIPAYTDQFPDGLNPLAGKTLDTFMVDVGNLLKGGLDNTTGVIGDLFNNLLSGLGLTDSANAITETLGMGSLFGPNRELGSGGGLSTFFPGLKPKPSTSTTSGSSTTRPSGASGGSQTQMEVAQTLVTEFKAQGLSGEGAKLATAEIGRENSLNINTILGSHMDGPNRAYGAISWQQGRERVLFDELRKRGIEPTVEGLRNSGDEGIRANAAAMIREMSNPNTSEYRPELLRLLKKQTLSDAEKDKVRQLMKDRYFRYDPTIPLQRSRDWYDRVNSFGLQSMVQTAPPDSQIPSVRRSSENIAMVLPAPAATPSVPQRPQPIITGNGSGTEGPDYSFFPPGSPDLFDVYGSQLGIA